MRISVVVFLAGFLSIALLGSAQAHQAVAPGYYGSTSAGGEIAFGAKFNKKDRPVQAKSLRWANVPIGCAGFPPSAYSNKLDGTMKVNRHGRFHETGKILNATITFAGKFKQHFSKATGTFRVTGTIPGCAVADTGKLGWDATRKP